MISGFLRLQHDAALPRCTSPQRLETPSLLSWVLSKPQAPWLVASSEWLRQVAASSTSAEALGRGPVQAKRCPCEPEGEMRPPCGVCNLRPYAVPRVGAFIGPLETLARCELGTRA